MTLSGYLNFNKHNNVITSILAGPDFVFLIDLLIYLDLQNLPKIDNWYLEHNLQRQIIPVDHKID